MNALLRKDLPWMLFFLIGGTAGMVGALCSSWFIYTFVVTPGHREELFHVAWSCGLGLGVVAACFDEALGVREFLACRPVSAGAVLGSRLLGCLLVLAGWFVLVPFAAYLVMALLDPSWEPGWFRQLPSIWGAMVPAVSMCAVGLCAGGLPFPWWVRLLCLPPLVVIPFSMIYSCERESDLRSSSTSWPAFVGGHLALAAVAVAWAWLGRGRVGDRDRPAGNAVRWRAIVPMLGVVAVAAVIVLRLLEATAVDRLHAAWPRLVLAGDKPVLAVRSDWNEPWIVVDAAHQPTGERLAPGQSLGRFGLRVDVDLLRVEAPRERAWRSSGVGEEGTLWVDADGTAFWKRRDRGGGLRLVERETTSPHFGTNAWVETVGGPGGRRAVVVQPGDAEVWLFDPAAEGFVRVPLPDGDLVAARLERTTSEPVPDAAVVPAKGEELVHGQRFGYALLDQRLVKVVRLVPQPPDPADQLPERLRFLAFDCLGGTFEYDLGAGIAPFRHRFEPRTATERTFAGLACLLSAMRPPLLQLLTGALAVAPMSWGAGVARSSERPLPGWVTMLLDPLVMIGARWWLVAASIVLAVLVAWATRRRLRRRGVDAATLRFWTVAVVLLGPVGALVAIACERRRAWADRALRVPPPAPRIASPFNPAEVVA
ncbi:MAG TPA: hypothetical protein VFT55_00970 [Planctomycetota bacterium]|nr:hypothetical protein [Planctomycetota bacterium]